MVQGPRLWFPVLVTLALVPAAAWAWDGNGPTVRYVPDADTDDARQDTGLGHAGPPAAIRFSGLVTVGDPTRTFFGPDPILWPESCHMMDISAKRYHQAQLLLEDGASDGSLEDLDLYVWDDQGHRLVTENTDTNGVGLHHAASLPNGAARAAVCLAGGADATYLLLVD